MSPLKYHYFHCFFTYSVRRNACAVRYGGGCHGVLEPSVRVAPGRRVASRCVSAAPRPSSRGRAGRRALAFVFAVAPNAEFCSRVIRFEDTARRGV